MTEELFDLSADLTTSGSLLYDFIAISANSFINIDSLTGNDNYKIDRLDYDPETDSWSTIELGSYSGAGNYGITKSYGTYFCRASDTELAVVGRYADQTSYPGISFEIIDITGSSATRGTVHTVESSQYYMRGVVRVGELFYCTYIDGSGSSNPLRCAVIDAAGNISAGDTSPDCQL